MAIELTDDGTLDTVLRCSECGEEFRYNYNHDWSDPFRKQVIARKLFGDPIPPGVSYGGR